MTRSTEPHPRPTYLGLLNAIALGERRGGEILRAWADASPDPEVRATLTFVAIRETEHGAAFAKRIHELGFGVRERPSERFEADLACAASALGDRDKFERILRYQDPPGLDLLGSLLTDTSIDAETGELLGRFIAEERDSERRLRACYAALAARPAPAPADDAGLDRLARQLDRLTRTLGELKALQGGA